MLYDEDEKRFKSEQPFIAKQSAAMRTAENAALYTDDQLTFGEAVLARVSAVYTDSRCFLNCGKKQMDVKVTKPSKSNKFSNEAIDLEKWCKVNGVTIDTTAWDSLKFYFNPVA